MKKTLILITLLAPLCTFTVNAENQTDLKTGKTLYDQMCFSCHASGVAGAPRLGVQEDWLHRLPLGLDTLYQAVIDGPNHMYSKGNSPIESEAEIRSMIAYMMDTVTDDETRELINVADEKTKARHLRLNNGYKNYDLVCFSCHDNGEAGAPRIGHPEDWEGRPIDIDELTDSVINGKGHMYTRALSANLSVAEYRNMVEYMMTTPGENPDSGESDEEAVEAKP